MNLKEIVSDFGCRLSIRGTTAVFVGAPEALKAASSAGCDIFLCFKQFDAFAKVLSQNWHSYGRKPACKMR